MRILVVSDVVDKRLYNSKPKDIVDNVDLIISCGDLPFYYLDFLVSTYNVPLLYVLGNHDEEVEARSSLKIGLSSFEIDYKKQNCFGGINIDGKVINIKGLIIGGLGGCKRYKVGPHQYTEEEMRNRVRKMYPKLFWNKILHKRYIDILVTHAPPRNLGDAEDLPHQGFEIFKKFIEKFKPKYLLHGHTHLYDSRTIYQRPIIEYKGTKIVNCFSHYILEI